VGIPAWDAASDLILDLREFVATGRREGWLKFGTDVSEEPALGADGDHNDGEDVADHEEISMGRSGFMRWIRPMGKENPMGKEKPITEPEPLATPDTVIAIERPTPGVEQPNVQSAPEGHPMLRWLWPFKKETTSNQTTATVSSQAVTERPTEVLNRTEPKEEAVEGLGISNIDRTKGMSPKNDTAEGPAVDGIEAVASEEQQSGKPGDQEQAKVEPTRMWPLNKMTMRGKKIEAETQSATNLPRYLSLRQKLFRV
jgi:hypothetical protein